MARSRSNAQLEKLYFANAKLYFPYGEVIFAYGELYLPLAGYILLTQSYISPTGKLYSPAASYIFPCGKAVVIFYTRKVVPTERLFHLTFQHLFQELPRITFRISRHLFGRAFADERTAAVPTFGAQIDDIIRRLDDV